MSSLTELLPASGESIDPALPEAREWIAERYALAGESWTAVNMITTMNGSAAGEDGTSDTISNRVDRTILSVIRDQADAVLVGAQSLRAEGYTIPRRAALAVLTRSGDLGDVPDNEGARERLIVLCPRASVPKVTARMDGRVRAVIGIEAADPSPAQILATLADHGLKRVICEGGPTVTGSFLAAGAIDEIFLTAAPSVVLPPQPVFGQTEHLVTRYTLHGLMLDDEGTLYQRFRPRTAE